MKAPTCIRYPRYEAVIRFPQSKKEPVLAKRIAKIENSAMFKEYTRLNAELEAVQRAMPRFVCWHCPTASLLKDLVLYDFYSRGDEFNNDPSHDYNIVCPKCGAFSHLKDVSYTDKARFKAVKEIHEP